MKNSKLAYITIMLVLLFMQPSSSIKARDAYRNNQFTNEQSATLTYGVNKGDIFTYTITRIDSEFDLRAYQEPPHKGDTIKIEVLENLNAIQGSFDDTLFESLDITDTRDLFKVTYPNGTIGRGAETEGHLYPISIALENGTTFDLVYFVKLTYDYAEATISQSGNVISVYFHFIYSFNYTINASTGAGISYEIIDSSGNKIVSELDGTYDSESSSSKPSLPLPFIPFLVGMIFMMVVVNLRRIHRFCG